VENIRKRSVAISILLSLTLLVVVFGDLTSVSSADGPGPSTDAIAAFAQQGKLTASDGATGNFLGFNVAISGDTAIAGAPRNVVNGNPNRGAAYVYVRTGTTWTQQQKIFSTDGVANDQFGYSVAVSGDTAAVGMYNDQDLIGTRSRGFVYIFQRTGTTWTQTQTLNPSDHIAGDTFGVSLAFENDTLLIGARSKTNGSTQFVGAAYVFTRPAAGGAFTQQAKLSPSDVVLGEFFGNSVGLSGDTAIVGAVGLAGFSNPNGKAYVFTRSGSTWTQQQKLVAPDAASGDAFGFSVAISGDTAIAGAVRRVTNPGINSGAAYVFQRSGATWTMQQRIVHNDPETNDEFGYYVAIKNETAVVSARSYEVQPNTAVNHGAVFLFTRSGANWTQTERLIHSDVGPDGLGTSVAYDGSSIIAGAPNKTDGTGAAYVFAAVANGSARVTANDGTANDEFGYSVALSGDTLVVGTHLEDDTAGPNRGAVYVFVRAGSAWVQQAKFTASEPQLGRFGASVAIAGDTIVVGAEHSVVGQNGTQGSAYVFTRSGTTWTQQARLVADDGAAGDFFGNSVSVSGDTVVVGTYFKDVGGNFNQGAAYVFTRAGTAWTQQAKLTADDGAANDNFGSSVSISGDTIVSGAVGDAPTFGSTYVFTRSGTAWSQQQKLTPTDGNGGQINYGISVALSGDTALVGAEQAGTGGAAYVYTRAGTTWTEQQVLVPVGVQLSERFGTAVSLDGNTAVAGAYQGNFNQGAAYAFRRSGTTWSQVSKMTAFDGVAGDKFGRAVAVSGNTAAVGVPDDDVDGKTNQGSAHIFTIEEGATPTPTPTPSAANTIQFGAPTFAAAEGPPGSVPSGINSGEVNSWDAAGLTAQASALINVTRTGDVSGSATVDYATVNGSASARSDYSAAHGTLRFAAGETSKSIVVFITDDRFQEGVETFSVALSNPSGATIGSPSSATINVTSDDAVNGSNPVKDPTFDSDFFVRQHYADFLGREADAPGVAFWKGQIDECETRPVAERQGCREVRRINVSAAFFLSIEFQQTGYFVYLFHQAAFNSREQLQLNRFLSDVSEARNGVVVGQGNWEQTLDANKQAFALRFVAQPGFVSSYPVSMTPAQFVDALNINTNGSLSQSERNALVAELEGNNTNAGRASVMRKISDDAGFRAVETNRAFVLMQYFGYLRRAPNESPDSNFEGFNFWLNKLNQFNGNYIESEMVKAFITSSEYVQRFGP